jgi:hypothetical protein
LFSLCFATAIDRLNWKTIPCVERLLHEGKVVAIDLFGSFSLLTVLIAAIVAGIVVIILFLAKQSSDRQYEREADKRHGPPSILDDDRYRERFNERDLYS